MTLSAYLYTVPSSGNLHVRVKQDVPLGDAFAEDMRRCGSPAHWDYVKMEWDYPLMAAAVLAIQRTADKHKLPITWAEDLRQFVEDQKKLDDYERQIRAAIENIMQTNAPLPGYVTDCHGGTMMPMRHQQIAYHWGLRFNGLLLAHDPGCLSGDTVVKIMRHSLVRPFLLSDLYKRFNGLPVQNPWKKPGKTTIKSLMPNGILRHNEVKQVLYRGVKTAYKITTASGKTLTATGDHEIAAPGGWFRVDHLQVGSKVLTNGIPVCSECGLSKYRITTYKYAMYRGLCQGCLRRGKRNGHYKTGKMLDKDGYVLVSGQQIHPNCNKDGCVQEHILVMEKHLGRYLNGKERVHHKDGIKANNHPDNLELMASDSEHAFHHGVEKKYQHMDGGRAGTGGEIIFIPREDTVVSIEPAGEQDVYDIVMAEPARNFVANGIIVHNCGKSRSAVDLSRGWMDSGAVRNMEQVFNPEVGKWGVHGGILVITKAPIVRTIAKEFHLWQHMTALEITGDKEAKERKAALPAHAHVVNYEGLRYVTHSKYDGLIIDEIHCASRSSAQTENTLRLAQHARRKLGLTGTPITNDLQSAFFQMLIIDGGKALGASRTKFLEEFFHSERVGPQGITKNTPKPDAAKIISERMALRTYFLKKEQCLDLPIKTHTPLYLEMTTDQARYYKELKEDFISYVQDTTVTAQQAAARLMKLRQVCQGHVLDDNGNPRDFSSAKVDVLIDMLKTKFAGQKVVIWAVFTHEINTLVKRLMAEGIGYVRLDGTVHSKKVRDQGLELWNSNPQVTVFIGQIQMGVGITLHAGDCQVPCHACLYLGIDYSYVNWTQSQDRIHRIGQKYPCSYTYLLTTDGVDRNIYQSLQAKSNMSNAVYRTGTSFYASLVKGDEPSLAALDSP